MTGARAVCADHRLLEYGSDVAFVDGVLPFLAEGMESAEPSMVVAAARHITMLQKLIGSADGHRVQFADANEWGSGNVPTRVLAVESAIRKMTSSAGRCRFVGEFTWPGATQRREWGRHEAAANLLHSSSPVSMLCTVDTRGTSAEYLDNLRRTHPILAPDRPNPSFVEPSSYLAQVDDDVYHPAPPYAETNTAVDGLDLRPVRDRVAAHGRMAGLTDYQIQSLALATTEIVANVLHHAGTAASVTTWTEESRFCCEVGDKGPGIADPIAAYRPPVPASGQCGLWLARTFSDELVIASSSAGTAVRISFHRPGR